MGDDDTYSGEIKLAWDDGPARPDGLDEMVVADIRESLCGLECPADLMFHHIDVGGEVNGPSVFVYGRKGSDAFHCRFSLETEWLDATPPTP